MRARGHHHPSHSQAGMTLVEVMLVLFIIGLASTAVVLALPSRGTPSQVAATQVGNLLRNAQDQAILRARPVRLAFDGRAVNLQIWSNGGWSENARSEQLPSAVDVNINSPAPDDGDEENAIIFDPTGVNEEIIVAFEDRMSRIELTFSRNGEIEIDAR